jgi:cysteinyl-tRNA synthetase
MEGIIGAREEESWTDAENALRDDPADPFVRSFIDVMDDDLNTAGALGLIFEKIREVNRLMDSVGDDYDDGLRKTLLADRTSILLVSHVLGILKESPTSFFGQLSEEKTNIDTSEIEKMVAEREKARAEKKWALADQIRDRLKDIGVVLEDRPDGTAWRLDV